MYKLIKKLSIGSMIILACLLSDLKFIIPGLKTVHNLYSRYFNLNLHQVNPLLFFLFLKPFLLQYFKLSNHSKVALNSITSLKHLSLYHQYYRQHLFNLKRLFNCRIFTLFFRTLLTLHCHYYHNLYYAWKTLTSSFII